MIISYAHFFLLAFFLLFWNYLVEVSLEGRVKIWQRCTFRDEKEASQDLYIMSWDSLKELLLRLRGQFILSIQAVCEHVPWRTHAWVCIVVFKTSAPRVALIFFYNACFVPLKYLIVHIEISTTFIYCSYFTKYFCRIYILYNIIYMVITWTHLK